jgi:protocatechuate 3,4-dioxygenase beta subunit
MNRFLRRRDLVLAALALTGPRRAIAALMPTPRQTTGPFYPTAFPVDSDNDLVSVSGEARKAVGTVTHVSGRVLDPGGREVAGALVEIWQCDVNGVYLHPSDSGRRTRDGGFQGYGRATTDGSGAYRFRTIRPVAYSGRTPHIHFAVAAPGFPRLVTQMYVAGESLNERDMVLQGIRDPAARASVIVALDPAPGIEPGALAGRFDIVLGA